MLKSVQTWYCVNGLLSHTAYIEVNRPEGAGRAGLLDGPGQVLNMTKQAHFAWQGCKDGWCRGERKCV